MTAEVTVMNTQGIAIAADSAITIPIDNENSKTYYTSQKIFSLSSKHSVGIMIYSNASFMDIDWEILITEFNKALGERVFDTLEEYAKYLLTFLKDFVHITDDLQKDYLEVISEGFFTVIKERYDTEVSENYKNQKISQAQQGKILEGVLKKVGEQLEKDTYSTGFDDYEFVKTNQTIVTETMDSVFSDFNIKDKMKEEMIDLLLQDIVKAGISDYFWNSISGLVFAGYGDKEIYPSAIDITLFGRLGKNVLCSTMRKAEIQESRAWIIPYAQHDVINTFIRGMDPDFKDMIFEELEGLIKAVTGIAGKKNAEKINKLKDEYIKKIEDSTEEYYKGPIMRIVSSLPKSDLAEMAEALVNLTALRRHVSTDRETVGGPTDVAVITKMDGFVWIKKKQTIQSTLNTK